MNKKQRDLPSVHGRSIDGKFTNNQSEGENFRTCSILGREVRVWGAEGIRSLSHEVTAALRTVIKKVRPVLPVALMADYHPAELGVVGSVVVSGEYVVPDVIGSDCGCGVYAMRTAIRVEDIEKDQLQRLFTEILKCIPVGAAQNSEVLFHVQALPLWEQLLSLPFVSSHDVRKLRHQLGSLGGGNHFIELASDPEDCIWLLVHSGSRYLGGLLKEYYRGRIILLGTEEGSHFFREQQIVLDYARRSRQEMADRVMECLKKIGDFNIVKGNQEIDLAHNFIELKTSSEAPVAIHRKGACAADESVLGVIPGSMGTGSYIVEGRGNPASYNSSSHGSGRLFSRSEAFKRLSLRDFIKDMEGIVWSRSDRLKDEAPRAYKDLDAVIRAQRDLIRVVHRLEPILSIKGEG